MTHEQLKIALRLSLEAAGLIEASGFVPARDSQGRNASHLLWMAEEIFSSRVTGDKAMRWLGYIQGVIVASYWAELHEMQRASIKAVSENFD